MKRYVTLDDNEDYQKTTKKESHDNMEISNLGFKAMLNDIGKSAIPFIYGNGWGLNRQLINGLYRMAKLRFH